MNIEQAVSHEYKIASHDKDITLLNISFLSKVYKLIQNHFMMVFFFRKIKIIFYNNSTFIIDIVTKAACYITDEDLQI